MGVKDDAASYQPSVPFEVLTNDEEEHSLGPGIDIGGLGIFGNSLILDTGATSIVVMNDADSSLRQNGLVIEGEVFEQGVAGFSILDVSAPYKLRIAGTDGQPHTLSDARFMTGQFPDLVFVNGIVGMPAMVGRTVSMEIQPGTGGGDIFDLLPDVDVLFSDALPADTGHRYSVPLTAKSFNLTSEDTVHGDDPLPIQAPLPMLHTQIGFDGKHASGSFALDTGAAVSFISTEIATHLGLDSNGDGTFDNADDQSFGSLPIGGIGGTVDAPVFLVDSLGIPTDQGPDLIWSAPLVLVLDIHPDLDGVVGSDVLTSGWIDLFGEDPTDTGPIDKVHFDFTELFQEGDRGSLIFDLDQEFDVVQQASINGDFNGDGQVNSQDLFGWLAAYGAEHGARLADGDNNADGDVDGGDFLAWQRSHQAGVAGDFNRDGSVDDTDLALWEAGLGSAAEYGGASFLDWQRNFGSSATLSATEAVPEPAAVALMLVAFATIFTRR